MLNCILELEPHPICDMDHYLISDLILTLLEQRDNGYSRITTLKQTFLNCSSSGLSWKEQVRRQGVCLMKGKGNIFQTLLIIFLQIYRCAWNVLPLRAARRGLGYIHPLPQASVSLYLPVCKTKFFPFSMCVMKWNGKEEAQVFGSSL